MFSSIQSKQLLKGLGGETVLSTAVSKIKNELQTSKTWTRSPQSGNLQHLQIHDNWTPSAEEDHFIGSKAPEELPNSGLQVS